MLRWLLLAWVACVALGALLLHGEGEFVSLPLDLRVLPGFLSDKECEAIREAALRKGMTRSVTVGAHTSSLRTSSTAFLAETDDPVVTVVFDKVTALLGASKDRFENVQVLRYEAGQEYKAHYDPRFKRNSDGKDLLRQHTVIVYLNDDFEGGATDFPETGDSVRPLKGAATVFRSMHGGKIVSASKHRGAPVARGTKWVATVWVRPE